MKALERLRFRFVFCPSSFPQFIHSGPSEAVSVQGDRCEGGSPCDPGVEALRHLFNEHVDRHTPYKPPRPSVLKSIAEPLSGSHYHVSPVGRNKKLVRNLATLCDTSGHDEQGISRESTGCPQHRRSHWPMQHARNHPARKTTDMASGGWFDSPRQSGPAREHRAIDVRPRKWQMAMTQRVVIAER